MPCTCDIFETDLLDDTSSNQGKCAEKNVFVEEVLKIVPDIDQEISFIGHSIFINGTLETFRCDMRKIECSISNKCGLTDKIYLPIFIRHNFLEIFQQKCFFSRVITELARVKLVQNIARRKMIGYTYLHNFLLIDTFIAHLINEQQVNSCIILSERREYRLNYTEH